MAEKENINNDLIDEKEGLTREEQELSSKIGDEIIEIKDPSELQGGDANYTADDLDLLEGLEHIRLRPGMYIGDTGVKGYHHLIWEIVDNAVDEAIAGFCHEIKVTLKKDNSIVISDDGRGVPVDTMAKTNLSGAETVFTNLNAGGKFGTGKGYKVSGGLHGVGAKAVNALSEFMDVTIERDGGKYLLKFSRGKTIQHLEKVGTSDRHGTTVSFKPDVEIFQDFKGFNFDTIRSRLNQTAFLVKGLIIDLTDERNEEVINETICHKDGLKDYVRYLNKDREPLTDDILYFEGAKTFMDKNDETSEVIVEFAMQYNNEFDEKIYSYCNNVFTPGGGTHKDGFLQALVRVFNNYARSYKILKDSDKERFKVDDVKQGLAAIISVKHTDPQYEGQVKDKLGNVEVKEITSSIVGEILKRYLDENKAKATIITEKIYRCYQTRIKTNLYLQNERKKNGIEIATLPGKLADCSSGNPEECELFIVEGNSAGGSAKNGRDPKIQAILPLRGKILNVLKANEERIMKNAEVGNLIVAIGGGFGSNFDVEKIRYHKVIIMTDADVDGSHITLLLLTFFNRFMKPLIENGYVYIAQPPLFKVDFKGKQYYAYSDDQLENIRKKLNLKPGFAFQRYKGLGEMDAEQLEETTMDPKVRKLVKVTIDDAVLADQLFQDLMGDEVKPRFDYISKNAQFVKNLDI